MVFADLIADLIRKDNQDLVSIMKNGNMDYYGTTSGLIFDLMIGNIDKSILDCPVLTTNSMTVAKEKEDEFYTFTSIVVDGKGWESKCS